MSESDSSVDGFKLLCTVYSDLPDESKRTSVTHGKDRGVAGYEDIRQQEVSLKLFGDI